MRACWSIAILTLGAMLTGTPANACITGADMDLHDIEYADVVVVGRVVNYEIVRDPVARQRYRDMPWLREILKDDPHGFMSDYARFDILVDDVLRGKAPNRLTVTWDNSTFGEPKDMRPGLFLIALRDPNSQLPPLRGPSATILPSPAPATLTILQAPCSGPFIFESTSKEVALIRQILDSRPK
jgi:hypothetical protein